MFFTFAETVIFRNLLSTARYSSSSGSSSSNKTNKKNIISCRCSFPHLDLVSDLERGEGIEPRAPSDHEPLLPGQLVTGAEGLLVRHLHHLVHHRGVHATRDGALAHALNKELARLGHAAAADVLAEDGAVGIGEDAPKISQENLTLSSKNNFLLGLLT